MGPLSRSKSERMPFTISKGLSLAVIAPILVRKHSPHGDFHNIKLLQEKHTHLAVDFNDFFYLLERSTRGKTIIAVARINLEFSGIT